MQRFPIIAAHFVATAAVAATCFAVFALSGCIRDNYALRADSSDPIRFAGSIASLSRASATAWDVDDEIGIYMLPAGSVADDAGGEDCLFSNARYVTSGNGLFEALETDEPLYYPADSEVDFIAYYPYTDQLDDSALYLVDVSDQSDLPAIDFLYSDNAKALSTGTPELDFHHRLTRLVFNVTDSEGNSLEGVTLTLDGMKTTGAFDLLQDALALSDDSEEPIVTVLMSDDNTEEAEEAGNEVVSTATFGAIVLPDTEISLTLTFALNDPEDSEDSEGGETIVATHTIDNITYKPGHIYTYNISLLPSAEAVDVDGGGIHDWNTDPDSSGGDLEIGKNPSGGDGDGGDNGGGGTPPTGEVVRYYSETFGSSPVAPPVSLNEFTGWSSGNGSVTYTNSGSANVTVRTRTTPDGTKNCMRFPSTGTSEVVISGLPKGYGDIAFSCTLSTIDDEIFVNPLRVYVGGVDVTPSPVIGLSGNLTTFSVRFPDGTTSIRLVSSEATINIGDITLSGIPAN